MRAKDHAEVWMMARDSISSIIQRERNPDQSLLAIATLATEVAYAYSAWAAEQEEQNGH